MQNGRKKGKFFVRCIFSNYYEKFTDYGAQLEFCFPDTVALLFY